MQALFVGDVIKLKLKYYKGTTALVIQTHKATSPGYPDKDGWISFDYMVLTEDGQMLHVSDDCVDQVVSRLSPGSLCSGNDPLS